MFNRLNNMSCLFCHSSSRKRHVALQIVKTINLPKIKNIKKSAKKSTLKTYNTDSANAFYKYFKNNKNYISSIYSDEIPTGTCIKDNVFCQNLEHLTFNDNTFDVVVSEDVLEHVRDYKKALREIHRVLKNGGVHIFTIPFSFDKETVTRIFNTIKIK